MARLLLLGPAHDAAGVKHDEIAAATVREALALAVERYGPAFAELLAVSQVWVNAEAADLDAPLGDHDELAVLPPISGGC